MSSNERNIKENFFLRIRPRRLRKHPVLRDLVRENHLRGSDLIMPLFITEGQGVAEEIASMPGQYRYSLDQALERVDEWALKTDNQGKIIRSGVGAFLLFGIPDPKKKDGRGSPALDSGGLIPQSVRAIKSRFPEVLVITDLCFCEYTDHGHCGVVTPEGDLDNDETLKLLGEQAVIHAQAGVDMVAPSGMLDGMVGGIRYALDGAGFINTGILSYAVKYASAFYGPFRSAVNSAPGFGDRRGYQMNPANSREALKEAKLDEEEGADILMVKPGMVYLDIVRELSKETSLPIAVYQVSGEYSMIKSAAKEGILQEKEVVLESLLAMKRAGASIIITYFAAELSKELPW